MVLPVGVRLFEFNCETRTFLQFWSRLVVAALRNPGHLRIKYLNLRRHKAHLLHCPGRGGPGDRFQFRFRIGHVTMDLANGEIVIDKVCFQV